MTPEQLKASILQYAVEGKLVKQDPNDEPASELLKKIENEKDQLIEEGKIKRSRKLPAITDEEKPFDIPKNWTYGRLKQITTFGNFDSVKGTSIPDNSWVVDMKDVRKDGGGFLAIVRKKSTDIYKSNKYSFSKNAVLYGKLRPYLRKVEVAKADGFTTTEMFPINVVDINTLIPQYLRYVMLSPYFVDLVNDSMYGMKMPRVGTTFLAKMVIPLPPLEEQKRIVAKIEKLMPLVDEYAESYNRLQKVDNEFEDKLKQSVLQYAMEGKLVKQNPSDEPASELVKASSIEKSHNEAYKIPSSWEWVRLGSGVKFINGRAYKKTELLTDSNLTPVLRVGNLFTNSSWYYSDLKLDEDKYIDNGDLIYAWSASFGPRIWNGGHVIYHYHIWKTVIKKSIDKKFLYYFLSDPHNVLGETKLHGSTMKHVTKTNMEKLPFPLPPLEEQKRIVAKIEKIMNSINNH